MSEGHLKRNIVVKTVEMRDGEVRKRSSGPGEFLRLYWRKPGTSSLKVLINYQESSGRRDGP